MNKCCCFDLKTGCMIIGIVELVLGILSLLQIVADTDHSIFRHPALHGVYVIYMILSVIAAPLLIISVKKVTIFVFFFYFHEIIVIFEIQGKPEYLKYWIVMRMVSIVLIVILMITALLMLGGFNGFVMSIELSLTICLGEMAI